MDIDEAFTQSNGFGFQLDSEFTDLFNYHLSKLRESGVMGNTFKKYMYPKPETIKALEDALAQTTEELGYGTVLFPFLALTLGSVTALVISLYERLNCFRARKSFY